MLKHRVLFALGACCAALFVLPDAALALSNAEHKEMLKNSPAYAKADAELNQAWKALRAALKKAGLEQQLDGGQKPPNQFSLLASQQAWLSRRDMEAEELRGAGSEADAHAAATRKRAAYLRGLAEELNRFAALPAPAADAPLMRLLKANGGSLYFEACEDEEEAEGSASAGGTPSPATLCANLGSSYQRLEINADGSLRSFTAGRPENPMNQFRWKLAADGSLITANWEGTDSHDFTLQGGHYLRWEDGHNTPARWFVLHEENRQPQESGAKKPAATPGTSTLVEVRHAPAVEGKTPVTLKATAPLTLTFHELDYEGDGPKLSGVTATVELAAGETHTFTHVQPFDMPVQGICAQPQQGERKCWFPQDNEADDGGRFIMAPGFALKN